MSEVIDVCKRSRIWYPPGWLLCLTRVRATINPKAYRRPEGLLRPRAARAAPGPPVASRLRGCEQGVSTNAESV